MKAILHCLRSSEALKGARAGHPAWRAQGGASRFLVLVGSAFDSRGAENVPGRRACSAGVDGAPLASVINCVSARAREFCDCSRHGGMLAWSQQDWRPLRYGPGYHPLWCRKHVLTTRSAQPGTLQMVEKSRHHATTPPALAKSVGWYNPKKVDCHRGVKT